MITSTTTQTSSYFTTNTNAMAGFISQSQDLLIEATNNTPYIKYSRPLRKLVLRGKATSANIIQMLEPVISMLKTDTLASRSVSVDVFLTEMNTESLKALFDLFKFLGLKKLTGGDVEVIWRAAATNPELVDTGLNFSDLYDLDVKIITV